MSNQMLDSYDKFGVVYDVLLLVSEKTTSKPDLAARLSLSRSNVEKILSFIYDEGLIKPNTADGFRLTFQGFNFLQEFEGIRKFLG